MFDADALTPPVLDAEQSLVGLALFDPMKHQRDLRGSMFSDSLLGFIYDTAGEVAAAGATGATAASIVLSRLKGVQAFNELGGVQYLFDLVDKAPIGADPRLLAREVHSACWRRWKYDDLSEAAASLAEIERFWGSVGSRAAWAKPLAWRPAMDIPQRQFVYGSHYARGFLSLTAAPGGSGKSAKAVVEALAMVSGKPLLGVQPETRLRVAYWNGEDPTDETERRIAAAMIHYGLDKDDIGDRLFVGSGREAEIIIAEQGRDGTLVTESSVDSLARTVRDSRLDVVIIDPFVSSHRVIENDNGAIDRVAKAWGKIAGETSAAIELVHHTRKVDGRELTVDDGRGASALLAAARSARVLNVMTQDEAEKAGVDRPRSFFRATNGKANLAPPPDGSDWYRFVSVHLGIGPGGGDNVGVVTPWSWPDPFDDLRATDLLAVQRVIGNGSYRKDVQASNWVGHAVAEVLRLDASAKRDKAKIAGLLRTWIANGALTIETQKDAKGNDRPFVIVGEWAEL